MLKLCARACVCVCDLCPFFIAWCSLSCHSRIKVSLSPDCLFPLPSELLPHTICFNYKKTSSLGQARPTDNDFFLFSLAFCSQISGQTVFLSLRVSLYMILSQCFIPLGLWLSRKGMHVVCGGMWSWMRLFDKMGWESVVCAVGQKGNWIIPGWECTLGNSPVFCVLRLELSSLRIAFFVRARVCQCKRLGELAVSALMHLLH